MRSVLSILALIQLVTLLQIGWAALAPGVWMGNKSDLAGDIMQGGDRSVRLWRHFEEKEARDVRNVPWHDLPWT